jgi:hypothetical protein
MNLVTGVDRVIGKNGHTVLIYVPVNVPGGRRGQQEQANYEAKGKSSHGLIFVTWNLELGTWNYSLLHFN